MWLQNIFWIWESWKAFQLLPFPDICKFDNRSEMTGEEVFLRGLYDLVNGEAKHNISIILTVTTCIYRNGAFESSAEAIGQKMGIEDEYKNMIAYFIDCNCLETCRVGDGPAEDSCESPVLPCIHCICCSTNESFFGFLVGSDKSTMFPSNGFGRFFNWTLDSISFSAFFVTSFWAFSVASFFIVNYSHQNLLHKLVLLV